MVKSRQDKIFSLIASIIMIIVMIIVIYPFLLLFMSSITDENTLMIEGYSIFPKKFGIGTYKYIWNSSEVIFRAYAITIINTLVGTVLHVFICTLVAYPLSLRVLPGKRIFNFLILFTMLFNGGLVSTYIMYTTVFHIKNTYAALLIPGLLFSAFNCIIVRTFFRTNIPYEMYESAKIDGASEFKIFTKIVLPLGKPIIVTISMFSGLNYWNNWTNGLYYITDQSKYTIQQMLNVMVQNIQYLTQFGRSNSNDPIPSIGLRMAIAFVAMLPLVIAFPFLTKYFEKGITLGAVKG